jgi:hypothetical protein
MNDNKNLMELQIPEVTSKELSNLFQRVFHPFPVALKSSKTLADNKPQSLLAFLQVKLGTVSTDRVAHKLLHLPSVVQQRTSQLLN